MGVRIDIYAVDLLKFDAFLNSSLADLLCQHQRDGDEGDGLLRFSIGETRDIFSATPRGPIIALVGNGLDQRRQTLTEDCVHSIEALQVSAREYLSKGSAYQASWFLEAFGNCKKIDFIKAVIPGSRRWWVGSLLQSSRTVLGADEGKQLEHLFGRILRDANCGTGTPLRDEGFVVKGLPFAAQDGSGLRFGRWDENDCSAAMMLLSKVLASSPTFCPPPGPIDIAPDASKWHNLVQKNVTALLQIQNFGYKACNVFTLLR